jgi:hypothetical protein
MPFKSLIKSLSGYLTTLFRKHVLCSVESVMRMNINDEVTILEKAVAAHLEIPPRHSHKLIEQSHEYSMPLIMVGPPTEIQTGYIRYKSPT